MKWALSHDKDALFEFDVPIQIPPPILNFEVLIFYLVDTRANDHWVDYFWKFKTETGYFIVPVARELCLATGTANISTTYCLYEQVIMRKHPQCTGVKILLYPIARGFYLDSEFYAAVDWFDDGATYQFQYPMVQSQTYNIWNDVDYHCNTNFNGRNKWYPTWGRFYIRNYTAGAMPSVPSDYPSLLQKYVFMPLLHKYSEQLSSGQRNIIYQTPLEAKTEQAPIQAIEYGGGHQVSADPLDKQKGSYFNELDFPNTPGLHATFFDGFTYYVPNGWVIDSVVTRRVNNRLWNLGLAPMIPIEGFRNAYYYSNIVFRPYISIASMSIINITFPARKIVAYGKGNEFPQVFMDNNSLSKAVRPEFGKIFRFWNDVNKLSKLGQYSEPLDALKISTLLGMMI